MSKSTNLRRRLEWFKRELAYRRSKPRPDDQVRFEIAALEWAIPILEDEAVKEILERAQAHEAKSGLNHRKGED